MSPMYMKALAHAAQLGQLDIRCGEPRVVARPSGTAADVCGETGSLTEAERARKIAEIKEFRKNHGGDSVSRFQPGLGNLSSKKQAMGQLFQS